MKYEGRRASAPRLRASRSLAVLFVFWTALALLASEPRSAYAAPVPGKVSGAVLNGHGRLVFSFDREVRAQVRQAGSVLIIGFDEPVDVSVDSLASAVPGYIGVSRRDPDGAAVRIGLARKVKINVMPAAEKLFVDLLPEGWSGLPPGLPQEVVDELARRAREAEEKLRRLHPNGHQQANPAPMAVRVASLPTFTRYMFPVPPSVKVNTRREKDSLDLVFDARFDFDLADSKLAASSFVTAIDSDVTQDGTAVNFALAADVNFRTFQDDEGFALDIGPIQSERSGPPPEPNREPNAAVDANERSKQPAAAAPSLPPPPSADAERREDGTAAPAQAARSRKAAEPASPRKVAESASPVSGAPAQAEAAPDPYAPVRARVAQQGSVLRILFPFRAATASAFVQRADVLWLVFDTAAPLDVSALRTQAAFVREASVAPSGEGQVVRVSLARPRVVNAAADGDTWIISLGDTTLEPSASLDLMRTKSAQGHPIVAIPFDQPQKVHRLTGSGEEGTLLVATGLAPVRGALKGYEFLEFGVRPSVHGVAVEPIADDLEVSLRAKRVIVQRPAGLAISSDPPSRSGLEAFQPQRAGALDPSVWEANRQADYLKRREALMNAAAEAPHFRRHAARLEFARFYLAHDRAAEAKGLLDVTLAAQEQRDPQTTAIGHVLRGLANLMLERPEAALKDFSAPDVGEQHDGALWRAVALSRNRRFAEAHSRLQDVDFERADLPLELQRLAVREAARCALEVGDLSAAARRLDELEALGLPAERRASAEILHGLLAERVQRPREALAAYRSAAESPDQPVAAQARLRIAVLRHASREISRNDTIAELEALTAGWRGDDTEAEGLGLLAHLYAEEGRYREAFQLMRVALRVHPRSRFTRSMQDEAALAFDGIFLGDSGGSLSPVEALGLFYDFNSLTPSGRRGDEMIRTLAERLIAVDLLSKASELLQHQVDHRLQGAARARVAVRLAMVYLMDRKPDRALAALRATRVNGLSNSLRRQRVLLEARALSDSDRHDLALELIAHLQGREVERLRADIQWSARRWRPAAEEIERLHGDRWARPTFLDPTERSDILRAVVGYVLADDALALDRIRERYLEKFPEGPEKRMFAVVSAPLTARGSAEFADTARAMAGVDTLAAFLQDLRQHYPDTGGEAESAMTSRQPG